MLQAEALATLPALTCVAEDLDADRQALTELAQWSWQFSPIVGLEDVLAPTCLFIDTAGCAPCLGGEERMIQKACAAFHQNGWTVVIALADTIGAAWAISHFPRRVRTGGVLQGQCGSSCFFLVPTEVSRPPLQGGSGAPTFLTCRWPPCDCRQRRWPF